MARLDKQFESKGIEYETPDEIYLPLNEEFGFTLDAAASDTNTKVKENYFTKEIDGLKQAWNGVVWLNPPFGKGLDKWMEKCSIEKACGNTVVALIPARTNTRWFHKFVIPHAEIRFVLGRPKFNGATEGLPWPMLILVFRPSHTNKERNLNVPFMPPEPTA